MLCFCADATVVASGRWTLGLQLTAGLCHVQIPFQKVRSLQVSPVPYLIGNFPLTVTLSLRLLMLTGADPLDIAR